MEKKQSEREGKKLYTLIGEVHDPWDEDYCLRRNENGYLLDIMITDRDFIIPLEINLRTHDVLKARKRRGSIYKALSGKEFTL